ncbi:MAG TPA: hypothetical protein VFB38_19105 [Chthonomonadaceae bacterium]|nr:hypothetical protein [Chthonomonadaceae bacterium]
MKRRGSVGLVMLLLVGGLLAIPVWLTYRAVQQEKANAALIAEVKKNDTAGVIAALKEGAAPNDRALPPDTHPFWQHLWDALRGRHRRTEEAPTALLVALMPRSDLVHGGSFLPPENPALIQALLNKGTEVNVLYQNKVSGWRDSPLILATTYNKRATIKLLLEYGPM